MKLHFKQLYHGLSDEELDDLDMFCHHLLRFQWLADNCTTWDEIIAALQDRIQFIENLKANGAQLLHNDNDDHIFYAFPNEHAVYATLTAIHEHTYEFQLTDGTLLTTPIINGHRISQTRIDTRLVLLITEDGEILDYIIPHDLNDY